MYRLICTETEGFAFYGRVVDKIRIERFAQYNVFLQRRQIWVRKMCFCSMAVRPIATLVHYHFIKKNIGVSRSATQRPTHRVKITQKLSGKLWASGCQKVANVRCVYIVCEKANFRCQASTSNYSCNVWRNRKRSFSPNAFRLKTCSKVILAVNALQCASRKPHWAALSLFPQDNIYVGNTTETWRLLNRYEVERLICNPDSFPYMKTSAC